jgi:DNA replication and repair protein RecF
VLKKLSVQNVRVLSDVSITPSSGVNLIVGANASGKTSLLESIYLLATGGSFCTKSIRDVIQHEATELNVFAVLDDQSVEIRMGLRRSINRARDKAHINGDRISSLSCLAKLFPVSVFNQQSLLLLEGGPKERRRYLDWLLFHVEPDYHQYWLQYNRILKQRNAAIKQRSYRLVQPWDAEFCLLSEKITRHRQVLSQMLVYELSGYMGKWFPDLNPDFYKMSYKNGWPQSLGDTPDEASMLSTLHQDFEKECRAGYTRYGPHKADWGIAYQNRLMSNFLSRGQKKKFCAALVLLQVRLLESHANKKALLLVDDLDAELDEDNRSLLVEELINLDLQVFVSSSRKESTAIWPRDDTNISMFHVEHGEVNVL